MIYFFKYRYDY